MPDTSYHNATIGGGSQNLIGEDNCTIAGGVLNQAGATLATIGGGYNNRVGGVNSTIPGGAGNVANGPYSFASGYKAKANHKGSFVWGDSTEAEDKSSGGENQFVIRAAGGVGINTNPRGGNALDVNGSLNVSGIATIGTATINGTATVKVLTISGADVSETFAVSTKGVPKGAVLVIDEQNPGNLKVSDRAYDNRVAGVVSGANGVRAGLILTQLASPNSSENVALSRRVYTLADAGNAPINPGDLLTTSEVPGHAMKVADSSQAQGAILGKAMTPLKEGRGYVLVLVSLQ